MGFGEKGGIPTGMSHLESAMLTKKVPAAVSIMVAPEGMLR